MKQGRKIGILENDFLGQLMWMDMLLYRDLEGDNCSLKIIAGGCDADCHDVVLRQKLTSEWLVSGYDRLIIEPPGIYDVERFLMLFMRSHSIVSMNREM